MKWPCVYILASQRNGTLYVGVTNDLVRRVWEHKFGLVSGFTHTYRVHRLVYAEFLQTMPDAILREKQIKKWRRAWKLQLIEDENPKWADLYAKMVGRQRANGSSLVPGPPLSRGRRLIGCG